MAIKELTPEIIKDLLIEVAEEYAGRGPGYAQESVVLREVDRRLKEINSPAVTLQIQQELLTSWHDLFISGVLSWGYNVDNPNSPWFHVARRELSNAGT